MSKPFFPSGVAPFSELVWLVSLAWTLDITTGSFSCLWPGEWLGFTLVQESSEQFFKHIRWKMTHSDPNLGILCSTCFTQVFARCLGKDSSKFRIPNISQSLVFNHPNQVLSSINFLVGGLKWFGTFGSFSIIYIGKIHQPLTFIFFEMVKTTTQMNFGFDHQTLGCSPNNLVGRW